MVLADYCARGAIPKDSLAEARIMLGDIARRQGNAQQAIDAYTLVSNDTEAPELWRGIARQNAATLQWNQQKPKWAVKF